MTVKKVLSTLVMTSVLVGTNTVQATNSENFYDPNAPFWVLENSKTTYEKEQLELVFDKYNLLTPSNVTAEEIDKYLQGTGLEELGAFYVRAEEETGINAIMLMSLNILESGWGSSRIAEDKNNLSGFTAYNDDPYESAMAFKSKGDCIMYVSLYLKNFYLTEGSKYYNGLSLMDVNENYCKLDNGEVNYTWNKKISSIANDFINKTER